MRETNEYYNAYIRAARRVARQMTRELRKDALDAGWSPSLAGAIKILFTAGEFRVHVPDEFENDAFDAEYGNENGSPSAVIRKFANKVDDLANMLDENLKKELKGLK